MEFLKVIAFILIVLVLIPLVFALVFYLIGKTIEFLFVQTGFKIDIYNQKDINKLKDYEKLNIKRKRFKRNFRGALSNIEEINPLDAVMPESNWGWTIVDYLYIETTSGERTKSYKWKPYSAENLKELHQFIIKLENKDT